MQDAEANIGYRFSTAALIMAEGRAADAASNDGNF
jgi:hypothetical protein